MPLLGTAEEPPSQRLHPRLPQELGCRSPCLHGDPRQRLGPCAADSLLPVRKLQSSLNIPTPTEMFAPESSGVPPLLGFSCANFQKLSHLCPGGGGPAPRQTVSLPRLGTPSLEHVLFVR